MANGLYTETCVKRKMTAGLSFAKFGLVLLVALIIISGLLFGQGLITFLGIAGGVALYFFLPSFDVEWEYIFCDGQIDFDRIAGGEKRKNMLKIDMDNVDIFAVEKSHELDSYNHQEGFTVKKFTSNNPDAKRYVIFTSKNGQKFKIIFEPSETMVEYARQKAPRKVFTM